MLAISSDEKISSATLRTLQEAIVSFIKGERYMLVRLARLGNLLNAFQDCFISFQCRENFGRAKTSLYSLKTS